MSNLRSTIASLVISSQLFGCGSSDAGTSPNQPKPDGGAQDVATDVATDVPTDQTPDVDLGNDFGVLVPTNALLCSLGGGRNTMEGLVSLRSELTTLTLETGLVRLPSDGPLPSVTLVKKSEVGPNATAVNADKPGSFKRTKNGAITTFEYTQTIGELNFRLLVDFPAGEKLATLSPSQLRKHHTESGFRIEASGETSENFNPEFITCESTALDPVEVTATLEDGSLLEIQYRCPDKAEMIMLTVECNCLVAKLQFTTGGESTSVTDYHDLISMSTNHCDMDQSTVGVFEPPKGQTHGIFVPGGPHPLMGNQPKEVSLLDASFKPYKTLGIKTWTRK